MGVQTDRARQVLHGLRQTASGSEGSPSGNQAVTVIRAHPQRLRVDVDSRLSRGTQRGRGRWGVGSLNSSIWMENGKRSLVGWDMLHMIIFCIFRF